MTTAATVGPRTPLRSPGQHHRGQTRRESPRCAGTTRAPSRRSGFTIVEILIVIIIIVVLAGLLLPAVLGAIVQAKITAARIEIRSMALALDQYRSDFGAYPPSRIWWERSSPGDWPDGWVMKGDAWVWRWTSVAPPPDSDFLVMDGAECLVYFLGGGPYRRGFVVGTKTFGPYFDPQPAALIPQIAGDRDGDKIDGDGFRALQDPFRLDCVYLYFKADRSQPLTVEYGPSLDHNDNIIDAGGVNPDGSRIDAAPGVPARDATGQYYKPTSFQLISPGRDGRYARPPSGPPSPPSETEASKDDITNFTSQ